jgi:hypothetical protein
LVRGNSGQRGDHRRLSEESRVTKNNGFTSVKPVYVYLPYPERKDVPRVGERTGRLLKMRDGKRCPHMQRAPAGYGVVGESPRMDDGKRETMDCFYQR